MSLRAVERHTRGNTGFRQHRLAQRQPLSAAVSKVTNGWKGLRLSPARSAAVMVKLWSKVALCATMIARLQSLFILCAPF